MNTFCENIKSVFSSGIWTRLDAQTGTLTELEHLRLNILLMCFKDANAPNCWQFSIKSKWLWAFNGWSSLEWWVLLVLLATSQMNRLINGQISHMFIGEIWDKTDFCLCLISSNQKIWINQPASAIVYLHIRIILANCRSYAIPIGFGYKQLLLTPPPLSVRACVCVCVCVQAGR